MRILPRQTRRPDKRERIAAANLKMETSSASEIDEMKVIQKDNADIHLFNDDGLLVDLLKVSDIENQLCGCQKF